MLQWLPWEDAGEAALVTAAAWAGVRRSAQAWARRLRPWTQELTLMLVLYAMWQFAGAWSIGRAEEAVARGRTIWDVERDLHIPSERDAQQLVLHHPSLVRFLNEYYAWVHVPALGICLLWLFVWHRAKYPSVRTVVVMVTGAALAIQLVPVAPPRLVFGLGMVDTGALIGPSEYSRGAPGIDQLSAMPSLHVGWALIIAWAAVWAGRTRWKWLVVAHPVLTIFAVVATGNHYWADGIVAAALCLLATISVRRIYRRSLRPTDVPEPLLVRQRTNA